MLTALQVPIRISIIIPTYNRAQFIGLTLDSFLNQEYPKELYEIIVIDNNSTDSTKDIVKGYQKNSQGVKVRYILEEKLGLHYGRNRGAIEAKFEMLYFTDDDTIADSQLLKEVIKPFEIDDQVATATGRVLPKWEVNPPKWVERLCSNSLLSLMDPPEDLLITRNLNFLYGCHQAVRKDVYIEVEGSNPDTFAGYMLGDGEAGLNSKIRELGYKFGYNGKSIIYHIMPAGRMNQAYLNKRLGHSGAGHSYREYRKYQPSSFQLWLMNVKIIFVTMPYHLFRYFIKMITSRDLSLSRFFIAYTYYYNSKRRYNSQLVKSSKWRQFVLKNDWVSNPTELDEEIKASLKK